MIHTQPRAAVPHFTFFADFVCFAVLKALSHRSFFFVYFPATAWPTPRRASSSWLNIFFHGMSLVFAGQGVRDRKNTYSCWYSCLHKLLVNLLYTQHGRME